MLLRSIRVRMLDLFDIAIPRLLNFAQSCPSGSAAKSVFALL